MISTKSDEVEVKTAETAEHKHEQKHKKFTVEEILNQQEQVELFDEYGRRKKIKVKVKTGKLKKREARMGYLFVLPYLIGIFGLMIYPIVMSFVYAISDVRYIQGVKNIEITGMANFLRVLEKERTLTIDLMSLSTKLIMAVPLIVVFALLMSMLLNFKIKGKGIFRTIYFLPVIVVSGPVMANINSESSSIQAVDMNAITTALQTVLPMWLASGIGFIFQNILLLLWFSGVQILIFLAALQKIDTSLYEAAKIDGGSGWECFWKITLPTIKPMLLLNALYTVVFLSQEALISPIINNIATAISNGNEGMGYSSAYSWMYSVIIMIFIVIVFLAFKQKKDVYAKQIKKTKKLEKKTRRHLAKHQKKLVRNEIKLQKAMEKEKKLKEAGVDLKGGSFDE
jgi:ABC-type sugar transport system permease subunit